MQGKKTRRRKKRKRQTIPDWWVAGLMSKGMYLWGLSWVSTDKQIVPPAFQNLIKVSVAGLVTYTVQMLSTSHHCLRVMFLGQLQGAGMASRTHIPRTGRGWGISDLPQDQLMGQPLVTSSWWLPPTISSTLGINYFICITKLYIA